jgi:hypothetical protein
LDNLEAVREKFQAITSRFVSFQAQWLNVDALLDPDGSRYAYRLTTKGVEVALLFSSFTNGCVDPLPTAASIIRQTAASKRAIIAPTRPSSQSLICSPPLDAAASTVELVFSNILRARI